MSALGVKRDWLERPGGRLSVLDLGGDGPTALLLHGLMGRATTWRETASWLSRDFHVVALDQRGHGRSDRFPTYSRDDYVEDARAAIETLGLAPALVVGHSMGALNGWVLAARYPHLVTGLVIEDMRVRTAHRGHLEAFRQWFASWPLPFLSVAAISDWFDPEGRGEGEFFAELFAEGDDGYRPIFAVEDMLASVADWDARDYDRDFEAVRCPVLVVHGERSAFAAEELRAMAACLPDGEFAEIAGAGHSIRYDRPAEWRAVVEPFVRRVGAANRDRAHPAPRERKAAPRELCQGGRGSPGSPQPSAGRRVLRG